MTHPADKVYRFHTLGQWGRGRVEGFLLGRGPDEVLVTPEMLEACAVTTVSADERVVVLAVDPCGRLLWLVSDGTLMAAAEAGAVRIAVLPLSVARGARRLVWGQRTAWVVSGDSVIRIDARSGNSTGEFSDAGWRVVDAVADQCDGVIVVEVRDTTMRLRRIRREGFSREIATQEGAPDVMAMVRWCLDGPLHVVDMIDSGFRVLTFGPDGSHETTHPYAGSMPSGPVTMDGHGRLVMAAEEGGVFSVAFGLLEPVRRISTAQCINGVSDLLWTDGSLYAAAGRKVLALRETTGESEAWKATWFGPVLHSPAGNRSGWLRADLRADLPSGARVRMAGRGFDSDAAVEAYGEALRSGSHAAVLHADWKLDTVSEHFGDGSNQPLRHYLGDESAEYLAIRIEVSVPACTGAVRLQQLDVAYPNRSLIEDLPAIYRNGTHSERQLRRMLAPFQALADEIDDLIGEGVRRVDSERADDVWTGFLLGWLGHGEFARLPAGHRRALLVAMPEILRLRGTLAGLVRVMEILVPGDFSIEDSGMSPGFWLLPKPMDPAGARLGRETQVARHRPEALVLGGCIPLGRAVLGHGCLDLDSQTRCSGRAIVRVYGGGDVRERLEPFTGHIARSFAPANTRVTFIFGRHRPPQRLGRSAGIGPGRDPAALIMLDEGNNRNLGAWQLPAEGPDPSAYHPPALDSARLDAGLILE